MINLSKTGSYALKAMIHLANHESKLFTIKEISTDLNISEALLRRIIANLEQAHIIKSIK
jgi:DNA-binding IscR family transcriptional regulator